jgi:hypothetical protein
MRTCGWAADPESERERERGDIFVDFFWREEIQSWSTAATSPETQLEWPKMVKAEG